MALLAACIAGTGVASAAQGYQVSGDRIEASLTGTPGDAARGRQIVENRAVSACLLCHSGPFAAPHLQGTIGPPLAGVGSRLNAGQIRLRLVDPRKLNPNSVMPAYYVTEGLNRVARDAQGRPALSAAQIEDVVAFLMTLRGS